MEQIKISYEKNKNISYIFSDNFVQRPAQIFFPFWYCSNDQYFCLISYLFNERILRHFPQKKTLILCKSPLFFLHINQSLQKKLSPVDMTHFRFFLDETKLSSLLLSNQYSCFCLNFWDGESSLLFTWRLLSSTLFLLLQCFNSKFSIQIYTKWIKVLVREMGVKVIELNSWSR